MRAITQVQINWLGGAAQGPAGWQRAEPAAYGQHGIGLAEKAREKTLQPEHRLPVGNKAATRRTNQAWLADLRGPRREEALADLRQLLVRGLGFAFAGYGNVRDDDLEDFAQEALLRILASLDTFRGESRFTTWAQKIAVRLALTELRRKRWKDVSLDELTLDEVGAEFLPRFTADPSAGPEQQAMQRVLLEQLGRVMAQELTERQQRALVAVYIQGMPMEETARRMDTNRNALYKLLHDARQRLKERILQHGISAQEMLAFFGAQQP